MRRTDKKQLLEPKERPSFKERLRPRLRRTLRQWLRRNKRCQKLRLIRLTEPIEKLKESNNAVKRFLNLKQRHRLKSITKSRRSPRPFILLLTPQLRNLSKLQAPVVLLLMFPNLAHLSQRTSKRSQIQLQPHKRLPRTPTS